MRKRKLVYKIKHKMGYLKRLPVKYIFITGVIDLPFLRINLFDSVNI